MHTTHYALTTNCVHTAHCAHTTHYVHMPHLITASNCGIASRVKYSRRVLNNWLIVVLPSLSCDSKIMYRYTIIKIEKQDESSERKRNNVVVLLH